MFRHAAIAFAFAASACGDEPRLGPAADAAAFDVHPIGRADVALDQGRDAISTVIPDTAAPAALCNGASALCSKTYGETVFLGTHSSMAAQDPPWTHPTQGRSLTLQLGVGGVRAFEFEVFPSGNALALCAGSCAAGSQSLSSALDEVSTFLENNLTDVLTLLFRNHAPTAALVGALEKAGLDALAHAQSTGAPWPALKEMIATNHRLVVFVDDAGSPTDAGAQDGARDGDAAGSDAASGFIPPSWLHRADRWIWETAPSVGFDCEPAKGDPKSPLIVLNHYVPGEDRSDAGVAAHDPERVATRLRRCQDDRGHLPTIVFVDFAEVGDPNGGVQIANGTR